MMWTVKIKTLNEDVVVAVLIAIQTIAHKPSAWVFIAQMVEHCSATRDGFESRWSLENISGLFAVA